MMKLWWNRLGRGKKRPGNYRLPIFKGLIVQWPEWHGLEIQRRKGSLGVSRAVGEILERRWDFISWVARALAGDGERGGHWGSLGLTWTWGWGCIWWKIGFETGN